MSRGQRFTMLGIAAVIAAVAIVIALTSGGDDSSENTTATTAADQTQQTGSAGAPSTETTSAPPPKPPEPGVDRIRIENGKPVGGVKDIEVEKGDQVRIAVTSDIAEELHLHGYDISRSVAAGEPGRMSFKANIEGVFELELENSGVPIAQLAVSP